MNKKLFLPLILLILPLGYVFSQINASFRLAEDITCTDIPIEMVNETSGPGPMNYHWNFGNGEESNDSTASVTYTMPGQYTIQLIASDADNADTATLEIEIFQGPTADFSADTIGCIGFTSFFLDASTAGDAPIDNWEWFFGDGGSASTQNINHTYATSGQFSPFLIVTDTNGCRDIEEKVAYINSVPLPTIDFSFSPPQACDTPAIVDMINNSSTEYGTLSYEWDFDDGSNSSAVSPQHIFQEFGNYSVELTASINELPAGCENSDTNVYRVINRVAGATFEQDGTPVQDSSIICRGVLTFNDTSFNATGSDWDFDDGGTSTASSGSHTYTDGGTYQVRLIAQPQGVCPDTAYWTIFVDTIQAGFDMDPQQSCNATTTYTLSADSSNAASWQYFFADGKTGFSPDTTYHYSIAPETDPFSEHLGENFETKLEVVSVNGCTDRDSVTVTIRKPTAWFGVDSIEGCIPLEVNFNDRSPNDAVNSPGQFHWIFGDGNTDDTSVGNTTYTYTAEGEYEARMVLQNEDGCVDTSYSITIQAGRTIAADFSLNGDTIACANEEIRITNTSADQNLIDHTQFYLGDEIVNFHPDSLNATWVNRLDSGKYNGRIVVDYNGCISRQEKTEIFQSNGPGVNFTYSFDCDNPMDYNFTGNIDTYQSFEWNFGDGNTNNSDLNPTNSFATDSNYNVSLVATTYSGCTDSITKTIQVRNDTAVIEGPVQACAEQPVVFNGGNSYTFLDYCKQPYLWSVNDSSAPIRTHADTLAYFFEDKGSYQVQLITENDNGCVDTASHSIDIFEPSAGFTADADTGCVPFLITYTDTSKSDLPLMEWKWKYTPVDSIVQDSLSYTDTVQFSYTQKGTYYPKITVTDTLGCHNTFSLPIAVGDPSVLFSASDTAICSGDQVSFDYNSEPIQEIDSVSWDYGDGNTSSSSSDPISHTYDSSGSFISQLIVYHLGCSDTNTRVIDVEQANARFSFSKDTAYCYPDTVQFGIDNLLQDIDTGSWNINNDTTLDYSASAQYIFDQPGFYPVQLTITTDNGCMDDYSDTLIVNGPTGDFSFTPDSICKSIPLTIELTEQNNLVDYYWMINNDSIPGQSPYEQLVDADSALVKLFMIGEKNCIPPPVVKKTGFYNINADFTVNDTANCALTLIPFINESYPDNLSYTWDFGNDHTSTQKNPSAAFNPGEYVITLTVLNTANCPDTKTDTLRVKEFPPFTISSQEFNVICEGATIHPVISDGDSVVWRANSIVIDTAVNNFTPVFTPSEDTWYTARIFDEQTGCFNPDSVFAFFQPRPDFDAIEITEAFYHEGTSNITTGSVPGESYGSYYTGEKVELEATEISGLNYFWASIPDDQCDTCTFVVVSPEETTEYILTVSDTNNCFAQTLTKSVEINEQDFSVAMPSAFTPDEKESGNDVVYVKGWGIQRLVEFSIYNRRGNRVFFTDDINEGWNGNDNNGKPLPMDTYTYVVRVETYNGNIEKRQGTISLIR
ncbi:MAG: PKD domain-containing protein [Bacteroidetes bacterium]|jgi:gliding motility-associated-like protein|nr:PKD domain-containing protein [Bacteroidota bacterium]